MTKGNAGFRLLTVWINLLRYFGPLVIVQVLVLGIVAEFPAQYFPRTAAAVDSLNTWFTALDILVALVVVGYSLTVGNRGDRQPA